MNRPVLVIVGPTGTGKSEAAVAAAHMLDGEVISADSMQVYRGMNIGTAKLSADEQQGIVHHMLDVAEPDEEFTVADYQKQALQCIHEVQSRGCVPILCGGSGLHVNSIVYDLTFGHKAGPSAELRQQLSAMTSASLYEMLRKVDPGSAERIHPNNTVRVRRAIEIAVQSSAGSESYDFRRVRKDMNFVIVGLCPDRMLLRERLDRRVDRMIEAGLVEEVRDLNKRYPSSRVLTQAIGYKELRNARSAESIAEGIERIKCNTKRFAKRQTTWFRRDPRITWFEEGKDAMMNHIRHEFKEHGS